jgi:hypothetical protein
VNNKTESSARAGNRLVLLMIAGVFVLPIVVAWLLAAGAFDWRPQGLLNHGTLFDPPIDLHRIESTPASAPLRELPAADWAVVFISDRPCDDACRTVLTGLSAIRLVIGKNGTRVSIFGVFDEMQAATEERLLVDAALVAGIRERVAAQAGKPALPLVGFIDWRGQLMMHFPPSAPPQDIKSDLKRLLSASAIK